MAVSYWRGDTLFALVAALAVGAKLWLTSPIHIIAGYAPHDASNFVSHAAAIRAGHWLGPYDELTLIKGPFFAMFIAFTAWLGVPLALAHQLCYAASCIVACIAIRPLVREERASCIVLLFLLFNPYTSGGLAWVASRSEAAESTSLLTVSCAAGLMLRRNGSARTVVGWSCGLGASLAAYWLTREDHVWLLFPVALMLVPLVPCIWRSHGLRRVALCAAAAIPFVITFAAGVIVAECNARAYGWRTVTEIGSPEFIAAYASLARIEAGARERRVPVTESQLAAAYRASSAANELKPALDGPVGRAWLYDSCGSGICYGIGGGWFLWALRDAAAQAGHYHTAPDAREYYLRLSSQIDAACDAGRLSCMPKAGLAPPMSIVDTPSLLDVFGNGAQQLFAGATNDYSAGVPWSDPAVDPALRADFERVVRQVAPVNSARAEKRIEAADGAKLEALQSIAEAYSEAGTWLACVAFAIVGVRVARSAIGGFRSLDDYVIVATALFLGAGGFLALLTLIEYYSFPAFFSEYFAVVYPVVLLAIAVVAAVEIPALSPATFGLRERRR